MKQLILDVSLPPLASFDNFITGNNAYVLTLIQHLQGGRAIYLWGESGTGKTHLLKAATQTPGTLYLSPASPDCHFQTAIDGLACFVAIDDIHRMTKQQLSLVFAIYNAWRASAASARAFALLVAGDQAPQQLELRSDLSTRLSWDLSFKLVPLSDEEKLNAVHLMALERGMHLSQEVSQWLITHYDRNMQNLRQLVESLDKYSIETKRPITLPLIREFIASSTSTGN